VPAYDYECQECGRVFDLIVPMRERDSVGPCPSCASGNVRRRFTTPSAYPRSGRQDEPTEQTSLGSDGFDGATVKNLYVENAGGSGIRIENSDVRGSNWRFKNNRGPDINSTDSDVEVDGIDIE
jgi:putative FmdB family regulatory protein